MTMAEPLDRDRGKVASWVRAHPIGAFLIWFSIVGWGIAFVPGLASSTRGIELPLEPFLIAATWLGLLLPAVDITYVVDGPERIRALRDRILKVRVALGWYVIGVVSGPTNRLATRNSYVRSAAGYARDADLRVPWRFVRSDGYWLDHHESMGRGRLDGVRAGTHLGAPRRHPGDRYHRGAVHAATPADLIDNGIGALVLLPTPSRIGSAGSGLVARPTSRCSHPSGGDFDWQFMECADS